MKLKQIAHIVKGKILSGSDEKEIQEHVSIDTRTMSEGDIFIAIIGKTQDGHIYAKEAEKEKAGVIIVSQEMEDISVQSYWYLIRQKLFSHLLNTIKTLIFTDF